MDGSRRVTERNRRFLRHFRPATTGLEGPTEYRTPQSTPVEQKQDCQKQDLPKQDHQKQDTPRRDQGQQEPAREGEDNRASPAGSPDTPEFGSPRSSPWTSPPTTGQS